MPHIYLMLHEDGRFYVGSTTCSGGDRFSKHKSNGLVKEFIGQWDNVAYIILEECLSETRTALQQCEQSWIDTMRSEQPDLCLNKIRASRRSRAEEFKEWYAKNKGTENDYYAAYRARNREKNREYARKYRESKRAPTITDHDLQGIPDR